MLDGHGVCDDRIWQQLPELERHHTPLSDHLCTLMDGWRASFATVVADFEHLYDTLEILGALVFCETLTTDQMDDEIGDVWLRVGRNDWRGSARGRILERVVYGEMFRALVAAGFGGGSAERVATWVKQCGRFAWRVRWR